MSRQLKRWESPRQEGRNHKGRGGSARQRQHRKQMQHLRQKLKHNQNHGEGSHDASLFLWVSSGLFPTLVEIPELRCQD